MIKLSVRLRSPFAILDQKLRALAGDHPSTISLVKEGETAHIHVSDNLEVLAAIENSRVVKILVVQTDAEKITTEGFLVHTPDEVFTKVSQCND